MKKNLKLRLTGIGSLLSKEKLKLIAGGDGSGSEGSGSGYDCGVNCWDGTRQGTNTCTYDKVANICNNHGGIQYGFNCTCP